MTKTRIESGILILFASLLVAAAAARAEPGAGQSVGSATGLPLPRFVSLKADEVNARVGPGGDYQIAWVFRRAGLPVEVLTEFENWRQVRDPSGSTGWINAALTSARRTAVVAPWAKDHTLFVLTSSRGGSTAVARIDPGAVVDLTRCDGVDCEVYVARQGGWIPQKDLWGVYPGETIK